MSVDYYAGTGYGLKVRLQDIDFTNPKYDRFKNFTWNNATENSRSYYSDVNEMFDEDNIEFGVIGESFPNLSFEWCGNPFISDQKDSVWFVVAKESLVNLSGTNEYADLSGKGSLSIEALKELGEIATISDDEGFRWYTWLSVG